jgi:hypothetical protein
MIESSPQMRKDLAPICPRDGERMSLGTVKNRSPLGDLNTILLYACNCGLCYNMEHGYFEAPIGDHIRPDEDVRVRCRHDGLRMFLSEWNAASPIRVWGCSALGCEGEALRMVRGTLHADLLPDGSVRELFIAAGGGGNASPLLAKNSGTAQLDFCKTFRISESRAEALVSELDRAGHVEFECEIDATLASRLNVARGAGT